LLSITTFAADGVTVTATYIPLMDGGGNVTGLADANTGAVVATYRYDPFGNLIEKTGTAEALAANPFGFSTKYFDQETGLYYFGYRYYSPELGRWMTRDPLQESGGVNVYGFVGNDPVNQVDALGLVGVIELIELGARTAVAAAGDFVEDVLGKGPAHPAAGLQVLVDRAKVLGGRVSEFGETINMPQLELLGGVISGSADAADIDAITNEFDTYMRQRQLDPDSAILLAVGRRVPIIRSVVAVDELRYGTSLGADDFGSSFDGMGALQRVLTITGDAAMVATTVVGGLEFTGPRQSVPIPRSTPVGAEYRPATYVAAPETVAAAKSVQDLVRDGIALNKTPVEIPSSAKFQIDSRRGYTQASWRWTDQNGIKYEARLHDPTSGAPEGSQANWRVERTTPGTGGKDPATRFPRGEQYIGDGMWVPNKIWYDAQSAYQAGTATTAQKSILTRGHLNAQ